MLPARQDLVPFVIDLKNGTARPRKQRLSRHVDLTFAATPMLGCIGVAPADQSPTSGPAGSYGGNLDYKEIREGATGLLPVSVPGAYLFLGDGHALQGDGEPVGSGIETSLDVEFAVELRKGARLTEPRAENAEYLISIGARTAASRSLNGALEIATSDMMRWLVEEYAIEPIAAHLLIGHEARYDVAASSGVWLSKFQRRRFPLSTDQGNSINATGSRESRPRIRRSARPLVREPGERVLPPSEHPCDNAYSGGRGHHCMRRRPTRRRLQSGPAGP